MTKSPQRILMTADTVGGVWTYAMELISALQPYGIHVGLATMGRRLTDSQRKQVSQLPKLEVFESEFKLEWMEEPWDDVLEAGSWLLDLEQQFQPDVVHLNNYAHGALPWHCPKAVVAHSCVLSWWRAVHGSEAPPEWERYRQVITAGIQAADMVIAPSETMLAMLASYYGPLGDWKVIHNGRKLPRRQSGKKEPLVFSAGRLWDAAKNVRALREIATELPWAVYLAGENKLPRAENLPDKSGASEGSLVWLGSLSEPELASWLSRASIFALPARYEPFGLSILEAALCGCALVLGDIPSLRELWNGAALFVPSDDNQRLKASIRDLIKAPARRKTLGTLARRRAAQYSRDAMASGYFGAYQEVCFGYAPAQTPSRQMEQSLGSGKAMHKPAPGLAAASHSQLRNEQHPVSEAA
jgi:glycosyltransferase involved in cell wall biosynthesis